MTAARLAELISEISAICSRKPLPEAITALKASIIDNGLNDQEIMRGYAAIRDAPSQKNGWNEFPRPGDFLEAARPPASVADVRSEADTILQVILDHPTRYGTYNPQVGTVYDRRRIEAQHGRAAGDAFASVAGRVRTIETIADEKWVRLAFCEAYEGARADNGAPLALTPPARQLSAPAGSKALTGTIEHDAAALARRRFSEMIHGPAISVRPPVDWTARRGVLMAQAAEMARK